MKVSVLINNYNYANYIHECIESVINQTYGNIEIILYDDGSTDNSLELVKQFGDKIKIIAKPNFKKYPSLNQANAIYEAFLQSSGDIICLLDSDDVFEKNKVELVVKEFDKNKKLVMVQHLMSQIDQYSKRINGIKKSGLLIYNEPNYMEFINKLKISTLLFMQTSALSFKKEYLEKILPLNNQTNILIWPDMRLSAESIYNGEIFTINLPLTKYRIHKLNDSKKLLDKDHAHNFFNKYDDFLFQLSIKYNKPRLQYDFSTKNKLKSIILVLFSKNSWTNKSFFIRGMSLKLPGIRTIVRILKKY